LNDHCPSADLRAKRSMSARCGHDKLRAIHVVAHRGRLRAGRQTILPELLAVADIVRADESSPPCRSGRQPHLPWSTDRRGLARPSGSGPAHCPRLCRSGASRAGTPAFDVGRSTRVGCDGRRRYHGAPQWPPGENPIVTAQTSAPIKRAAWTHNTTTPAKYRTTPANPAAPGADQIRSLISSPPSNYAELPLTARSVLGADHVSIMAI
jgi:hypothetical protein